MRRLTGMDATFLYLETPNNHMHVGAAAVFDPSTVEGGYSFAKVRDLVESRLHLLPPFRWRLVEVPFQLHHPLWIEDPDFDLEYHVRRAALPRPGGVAGFAEFSADVLSRPLDRRRPLWEMYVVEGLEHGHIGIVSKTHHSAIDGVSGAELIVNLLDLEANPPPTPPPERPWVPDRQPSDAELVGYALASLARQPVRMAKTVRRTVETVLHLRDRNRRPDVLPPPTPFSAPKTSLNAPITPHRRVAFTQLPLDDLRAVKAKLGVTVNDVFLAVCAGGLRRLFDARGETLDGPMVAMVPISVRAEDEKGSMGNRVSAMLTTLATDVDDPIERLRLISEGTKAAKEQDKAISASVLGSDWAEFAAPALAARAARLYARMRIADRHRPLFNVTISNVPGPPFPLYSAGARMVATYPMGPIFDGGGLNITVMSYMGVMCVGLVADRELLPEVWDLAHDMEDALEELAKAAAVAAAPAGPG